MENQTTDLQIQQNKPTSLALTELSRPTLAKLNEDFPKVRNIESKQEINGLLNFLITILNIKSASEQEQQQLDKQMILIFDLIKTKFGSLTVPEIKEAFKMYVSKEFPDVKVFRVLDCVAVGEVLNAFREFRNESLKVYDAKKKQILEAKTMTPEEKQKLRNDFLMHIFQTMKSNKKNYCNDAWLLADELKEKITTTQEVRNRLHKFKSREYQRELEFDAKTNKNKETIGVVVNRRRSVEICHYLRNYLTDFETFKNEIENG